MKSNALGEAETAQKSSVPQKKVRIMQLSELYGPAILLPRSKAAYTLIEIGLMSEDTCAECYCIPVEHILDVVIGSGLIDQINESCPADIGFLSLEKVPPERLPLIISAIEKADLKIRGPIVQMFCDELKSFCKAGIEQGLPLYFVGFD